MADGTEKDNWMRSFCRAFLPALATLAACLPPLCIIAPSAALAELQHRSHLRIAESGARPQQITLGLNKSMVVELPREAREVMVSNPEQVDAVLQTSTRAYLIGKGAGEANIIFIDKDGRQVATLEVVIERDFAALGEFIGRIIPGAYVRVNSLNGYIVLTGTVQNAIDATRAGEIAQAFVAKSESAGLSTTSQSSSSGDGGGGSSTSGSSSTTPVGAKEGGQVINMITVGGREQVLLKVSVVEMERNIIKQFGVDLNALVNSGDFLFAALSDLPFPINVAGKGLLAPFSPTIGTPSLNPTVSRTAGFGTQWSSGPNRVQGVLRALEENGLLHTLAEPNLTAISGETANFLAGGEFPVPVAQQLGTISIEFKKFGIGLAFTPVVMSEGRISLKVSTEVSELTNQGAVVLRDIQVPALKVRRAETTRRASERRLAGDGWIAVGSVEAGAERLSRAQEPARARHAVQKSRLSEKRDRARRPRDPLRGEVRRPLRARAARRRLRLGVGFEQRFHGENEPYLWPPSRTCARRPVRWRGGLYRRLATGGTRLWHRRFKVCASGLRPGPH